MEGSPDFPHRLGEAVATRARWVEARQVPQLKEALRTYSSFFESIAAMLIRKGLLREDPYNYDDVNEISIPPDTPLPEFDNTEEVSYRLAIYRRQLTHVVTSLDITLAALTLARLKKISALLSYVSWADFGDNSSSPTTRGFARIFMKVRMGADVLAAHILKDSQTQIDSSLRQARTLIGDIVAFQRESWKAEVRAKVLPHVAVPKPDTPGRREEMLRGIKRAFVAAMPGASWFPALIDEILAEELDEDSTEKKARILAALAVPAEAPPEEKKASPSTRPILLEAVRILSRPHAEMAAAAETLEENENALRDAGGGLGGWLRTWLRKGRGRGKESRFYDIQYEEATSAWLKTEKINFPQFLAGVRRKSQLLASLAGGSGPAFRRLEETPEEQLVSLLDRQLHDMLLIHRRMASFNTLFQALAARHRKAPRRGIRIQLMAIKNAIAKANQRRHDVGVRAKSS